MDSASCSFSSEIISVTDFSTQIALGMVLDLRGGSYKPIARIFDDATIAKYARNASISATTEMEFVTETTKSQRSKYLGLDFAGSIKTLGGALGNSASASLSYISDHNRDADAVSFTYRFKRKVRSVYLDEAMSQQEKLVF
ncbi:Hypothetical Protein FCC1311_118292, partial [Hondaea fermentalgiana]